jgi:hypothetical protein
MSYEEKVIKVTRITLDQENPRFPPVNSQREAIDAMLQDQGEKIIKLAQDIYQNGINPSSRPILFKDGKKLIDGDGNRRITVLKILETPSLADSHPKIKTKIEAILKKFGSIPNEVSCVIFEDRESARHWISINHGGQQEGRGQINWDAEQTSRFERKPSIGLEALDQLTHKGLITDDEKKQINKSTLDRLLGYKDVKTQLSITKKGDHFSFGKLGHLKSTVLNLRNKTVDEVYTATKGKQFVEEALAASTSNDNDGDAGNSNAPDNEPKANDSNKGNRSRRTQNPGLTVFGGKRSLKTGHVNNLYRDIESLYQFYLRDKKALSADFIVLFRMSLRLLAETASKEQNKDLKDYLIEYFEEAKKSLNQDAKTSLSNQSVHKSSIVKLFHTGAHDYTNSRNEEQALAMSIILGAILNITHGK